MLRGVHAAGKKKKKKKGEENSETPLFPVSAFVDKGNHADTISQYARRSDIAASLVSSVEPLVALVDFVSIVTFTDLLLQIVIRNCYSRLLASIASTERSRRVLWLLRYLRIVFRSRPLLSYCRVSMT